MYSIIQQEEKHRQISLDNPVNDSMVLMATSKGSGRQNVTSQRNIIVHSVKFVDILWRDSLKLTLINQCTVIAKCLVMVQRNASSFMAIFQATSSMERADEHRLTKSSLSCHLDRSKSTDKCHSVKSNTYS